jgi:histidine ammonia-lyase
MAVRANQIGAGGAGIGEGLLDALLAALRADVTPFARELGSLGTGDLTVLAEIGAALGGEGDCWVGDDVVPASEALATAGLTPVRYGPRDGLAFMSSNAVSIGQAALVFHDARRLLEAALGVAALSYDATDADLAVLDPRVHAARPHRGQVEVAHRLRELLGQRGARVGAPPRPVHDAFVFRCVPQVEGTQFDALERLAGVLDVELNVAGENALMLPGDGVALPNGNFHAGVLTLALDSLRGAMAQSASLIAARVSALLDPEVTGLTPQLAQDPGPDSGAMILEYTAHAAAAEVRSLAATAASQTTTVQSGIESHANFAGHSARRTSDALARMSVAISAELVLAVRALRLRGRPPSGPGVRALYEAAAARLDADMADRPLSGDLEAARQLLFEDALWMEAE